MPGSLTNLGENWALDILVGRTTQSPAFTPYLSLLNLPSDDSGSGYTEVSATGYARKACGSAVFGTGAAQGAIASTAAVDFGSFSTDAGSITGVGFHSAVSGTGNMYAYASIQPQLARAGDPILFPAGAVVLKLAGSLGHYGANLLLNLLTGRTTQTPAITSHIALYNTLPDATDAGGSEVSTVGTAYARQALGSGIFGTGAANGQILSTATVTFGPPTGAGFGSVQGAAIRTAATAGSLLCFIAITAKTFNAGDPCFYPAGSLMLSGD